MKKMVINKLAIGLVCFIAGAAFMWGAERLLGRVKVQAQVVQTENDEDLFGDDFMNSDPFQDMRRMQKQMRRLMGAKPFTDLGRDDIEQIKQREDDQFIYFDIDFGKQTPKEFNVQVENGMVTLEGKVESKQAQSYVSSSFHRSFPVPPGVEAEKFQMEQADHAIVIKFPKIST